MVTKRSLIVVVVALVLLAVALLLPATAFGAKPSEAGGNKPLNWATSGENTNKLFRDYLHQSGHSYLVKELSDGSIVGHVTFHSIKDPVVPKGVMFATELSKVDPFSLDPLDFFVWDAWGRKVVEFVAWFDMDKDGVKDFPAKIRMVDGGEPKTLDELYLWFPNGLGGWYLFGAGTPVANVQVHLGLAPE